MLVKCKKTDNQNTQPVIEELEPRILFSAGLEGIVFDSLSPDRDSLALYQNKDEITLQSTSSMDVEAVVSSRHELVFIDTNTPDYQVLVDDLLANNGEDRTINLVLLDSSKNGIQQISDALANYDGLDAVHIISHGSDGTVQLGNSQLDLDSLLSNTDAISSWGNAFSIDGDLLFYGCDLAATKNGQSLINSVAKLTGTDVAASEDLTGNSSQGGDWELEYQQGQLESGVIFSQGLQQQWQGTLGSWLDETGTPIGGPSNGNDIYVGDNNPDTGINGSNGNDTIYGAGGNDNLGSGNGDDVIIGGDGDDIITGQGGTNVLDGGAGNDQISGGSGSDVIIGGGGNDILNGGSDSDFFYFTGAQDGDIYTVNGNSGVSDTIDLTEFGSGNITYNAGSITVDLSGGQSFTINYSNIDIFIDADSGGNHVPQANAGTDQFIAAGSLVTLDASASSDLDPDTLTYRWVQIQGPWVGVHNSTAQSPSFTAPATPTNLKFAVIVSDGSVQNIDTVNIIVSSSPPPVNQAPTITKQAQFTDSGQSLGNSNSLSIATGDVDGDGDLDMVIANYALQANKIWLNDGSGNYTDSGQALGNSNSDAIVLGDIDGDGDLDIVVANFSNLPNKVYTNDGNGTFTDSGQTLGNSDSTTVALGDIDGDGDLDMVVGNFNNQSDKVFVNNGSGIFTDSGQALGSLSTRSIALGDVDGDGDLDIVAGNQNSGSKVFINNGSGVFTDNGQTLGASITYAVALGDIDGDGDLDLVEANLSGQANKVYTNDGSGIFTDSGQLLGSGESSSLALGDIDGDGDLDLVIGNFSDEANKVYSNDGNGAFTDSGQLLGSSTTRAINLADVDSDGDLDVIAGNDLGQANKLYFNDSVITTFSPLALTEGDPAQTITSIGIIGDVDSGNFDGGYFFVSYSSLGDSGDQLSINNQGPGVGQIGFDGSNVSYEGINIGILNTLLKGANGSSLFVHLNTNATSVAVTALLNNITFQNTSNTPAANRTLLIQVNDGDGGNSIPVTQVISITAQNDAPIAVDDSYTIDENTTLTINPGGFISNTVTTGAIGANSVFSIDVDGDGDIDLLSASQTDDSITWYENDGSQNFTAHTIASDADGALGVHAVDLDGDGDIDVLSASKTDNRVVWYENDGSQNFTAHTIDSNVIGAQSVHAADVDGDGDIDVFSASFVDDRIAWYENDGNENFTTHTIATDADGANIVFPIDVDGDGDIDVLSSSWSNNRIAWHENDGSGNFTTRVITTNTLSAEGVHAADMDGDGDIDIVSTSFSDNKVAWYENDGNENFTSHTIATDAIGANSVYAIDVDGDGDTDVLSASYDDRVVWYENDGSQNFTTRTIAIDADGAEFVHANDIDGDGDIDVLSASVNDNKIAWYDNPGRSVLANDTDADGDLLIASLATSPSNGSLTFNADGSFTYTPNANFSGTDSFSYDVSDGNGGTDTATVNITITQVNTAPTTTPVTLTAIAEDSGSRVITQAELLTNANDIDGDSLTATGLTLAIGVGSLTDNGDSTWTYTPALNDDTSVSFSYLIFDGLVNTAGSATLDITPVNDDPFNAGSLPAFLTGSEDISFNVNLSSIDLSDADAALNALTLTLTTSTGGNLTATPVTGITIGGSGTGVVTLTGNLTDLNNYLDSIGNVTYLHGIANTNGFPADTLKIDITDNGNTGAGGGGTITLGTRNINILSVNDAPITDNVSASGNEDDTSIAITLTGSDVDGSVNKFRIGSLPANGTLYLDAGMTTVVSLGSENNATGEALTLYFVPDASWAGTTTFQFAARDNGGILDTTSATATITVTLLNDAPTVNATASDTGTEDTDLVYTHAQLLSLVSGTDVDDLDAVLTIAITNVNNGDLVMTGGTGGLGTIFTFAPTPNSNSNLTFDYQVSDDNIPTPAASAIGTATVTINAVNDAPVVTTSLTPLNYAEQTRINIDSALTLSDIDDSQINGATISIISGLAPSEDTLNFVNQFGITGIYNSTTGVLTLTGTTSIANYEAALRTIKFRNSSDSPDIATRTISFVVDDGTNTSIPVMRDIVINPRNDAPQITAPLFETTPQNTGLVFSGANGNAVSVSDPDLGNVEITLTVTNGTLSLNGMANLAFTSGSGITDTTMTFSGNEIDINNALNGLIFNPASGFSGSETLQIIVDDQGNTGSGIPIVDSTSILITVGETVPVATDDPGDFNSDISALNPVGNWRLGEANGTTVVDNGSAGANGTFNGPALGQPGALNGDSDSAVYFDGVDDYIEITHSNDFLLDNGTFQFWFNADTIGVQQALLSKDHINFGTGGHVTIWMTDSGTIQVRLQSTTTDIFIESSNPATAGQWHHVAFSFGSNGMELYVDGTLADVNGYTGGLATTSGGSGNIESIVLGASKHFSSPGTTDNLTRFFQGSIDEVSITGNQLDAEQIQNIFTAGLQNYTIAENTSLNVATSEGVLINDADADGDLLTAILVNGPSFASSFTLNSDGSFDYTPNAGFDGTDSFTYQASDGSNNSNLATVTITVTGVNNAPVTSPVTLTSIAEDSGPRIITQTELLSNASDPDSPSLIATGLSIITGNGSLADNGDGTWTYSSDLNDNTNVSFSYTITDSVATITGSASLDITPINDLPVITSNGGGNAATVTLVENTTAVTDVDATDADLDTLNYSISGGADATLFNIDSSTGLLTFITAPDFEIPSDFDANNVYEVSVQVSDGSSVDTQAISVTVTDVTGTLIVTTNSDTADGNTASIESLITDKGADGEISLREAILAANNTVNGAAPDEIRFNIGSGLQTITPTSELPFLTDAVILDATSQPGYSGTPLIQLDGSNAAVSTAGLNLLTDNSTIRGFIVHSFADEGIEIGGWSSFGGGDNNLIENNWVGIDATGVARPNADTGILITVAASNNIIRNNIVSGNNTVGIEIRSPGSDNNIVEGNLIGVSVDGSTAVGNLLSGITISGGASNNRIGTNADGVNDIAERNIISGNLDGIFIIGTDTTNNLIQGNYIGTDISGLFSIGNRDDGIDIRSSNNKIGGTTAAAGNLISGNNEDGILLRSTNATGNIIQGNTIGTDISSASSLSNHDGIQIDMGANNNLIGGTNAGAGNQIAFNNQNGIYVANSAGVQNAILGNSINGNAGLGIDLGGDGVTANDVGDIDSGPNNNQNYPVLANALINADGSLSLTGTLNSTANTTFRIEFFTGANQDATGNGEGQTYIGSISVTTDPSGNAQFSTVVTSAAASTSFITATATVQLASGVYGNTSEFADNVIANTLVIPDPIDPPSDPEPTPDPEEEPAVTDDPDPGVESTPDPELDLDPITDPRVQQRPTPTTHQPVNPERTIYQYFEDIAETITEIPADVLETVINRIDIPKTMLPLQSNIVLWNAIDSMLDELDDSFSNTESGELIIANAIRGTTWTLSAGFVAWILRGGSLIAAAMSSIPIWKGLDPLPVIAMSRKEREKREKDKHVDQQEEDELQKEIGELIDGARLEESSNSRDNRR